MDKILRKIFVAALLTTLFTICPVTTAGAASGKRPSGKQAAASQNAKKARHYYLAGAVADAEGRQAEAYELYKKAHRTDPSYPEAAYSFGVARLGNRLDTLSSQSEVAKSIELIRLFADSHPRDIQENLYYAYLANFSNPEEAVRIYRRVFDLDPKRTSLLLQLTEAYIRSRKFSDALEALNRYEAIEGENPAVSARKVQLMVQEKDTAGALGETERLIKKYPSEINYRMLRGSLGAALGDSALWEEELLESQRIEPDNAQVKLALAELALARGDSAGYDNMVYESLLSPTLELDDKIDLLTQYLQQLIDDKGDRSRGDNLFKALESQYPHQPELLELESRYRMASGDYDEGIDLLEYALSLDPSNEEYWHRLMGYGIASRRYYVTRDAYNRAKAHISPDNDMEFVYALACGLDNRFDDAIDAYSRILSGVVGFPDLTLRLDSLSPLPRISADQVGTLQSVYTAASDIYFKSRRFDELFDVCENALFLAPGDPLILNNYAYFLSEAERQLPKALEMIRQATEADPDNPTYLDTYAWVLFKSGDYPEALKYQRRAIEAAETESMANEEFYTHLARILDANGLHKDALEAAAKAEKLKEEK